MIIARGGTGTASSGTALLFHFSRIPLLLRQRLFCSFFTAAAWMASGYHN
jgi:hypothetical protein